MHTIASMRNLALRLSSLEDWPEHTVLGATDVWVDALLDGCAPILGECRLIGRRSSTRTSRVYLRPAEARARIVHLPRDLTVGDLVAFPCELPTSLHDLRRRST